MKLFLAVTIVFLFCSCNKVYSQDTGRTQPLKVINNMPPNQGDSFNAKKELNQLRSSVESLRTEIKTKTEIKKNDVVSVIAIIFQAIGFLVLLGSWYYQNQRQADWEEQKDKQRWVMLQTMTFEGQIDMLEYAVISLGLDGSTERSKHPEFKKAYRKYLDELSMQTLAYLRNIRKMYGETPEGKTKAGTEKVDSLIDTASKKIETLIRENNAVELETYVWEFRVEQRWETGRMGEYIYKHRDNIAKQIEISNDQSKSWYIVGSILVIFSFILQVKKDLPEVSVKSFVVSVGIIFGIVLFMYLIFFRKNS